MLHAGETLSACRPCLASPPTTSARVARASCITNLAAGITSRKLTHNEVMVNAGRAVSKLLGLLDEAIPELPHGRTSDANEEHS